MQWQNIGEKLNNFRTKQYAIPMLATAILVPALILSVMQTREETLVKTNAATIADATVTIDAATDGVSELNVGVTHMQYSLDSWGNTTAVLNGKNLLRSGVKYQNQHIIGFGADDINPSPGVYSWGSLDARIQTARDSGNEAVITICCAPGWMKASGNTWANIEEAPTVAHHQDYANLAAQVAARYPDVKYFQVWNEMKGMWSDSLNRWDYERYTDLYNKIWTAVKAVRPDAKIGGPYVSLGGGSISPNQYETNPIAPNEQAVLDYWATHKLGADFLIVDGWVGYYHEGPDWTKSSKFQGWTEDRLLNGTRWFGGVTKKLKQYNLPIWWAEDYFVYSPNDDFEAVGLASMLYHELKGGASTSLRWMPQATAVNNQNLFTDTRVAGGGQPFPNYYVYKDFHTFFGPGTQLLRATSSDPKVLVLASQSKTMLINQNNIQRIVSVNGTTISLGGYKWVVLDTPKTSPTAATQPTNTPPAATTPTPTPFTQPTNTPIPTSTPLPPTSTPIPTSTPTPSGNRLLNGSFENRLTSWVLNVNAPAAATLTPVSDTKADGNYSERVNITRSSSNTYLVQLRQDNLSIIAGKTYTLTFWAKASKNRSIDVGIQKSLSPYTTYAGKAQNINKNWTKYTFTFTATATDPQVFLRFNLAQTTSTTWIDGVTLTSN